MRHFHWPVSIVVALLAVCAVSPLRAQTQNASINGNVTDASKAVIQGARVAVTPGNFVTTSDRLGDFVVIGLTPGTYTVTVTSAGFSSFTQNVTLTAGQALELPVVLQVASANEQVVVSAGNGQNMIQAINEEINSPNIVNVMPQAEILALPNANVADAIGRLPGVTVQRDEGEAVYVQVRGLDPRLTNTTIDGVTIPSPESNVRQVLLATISADMVQSIELNKTLSANQDADGIGGSVNMVTKMAGEAAHHRWYFHAGLFSHRERPLHGPSGLYRWASVSAPPSAGASSPAPVTITTDADTTTLSRSRT